MTRILFLALLVTACTESSSSEPSELEAPCTADGCGFCAIATFDGPAFYAHNFATYEEAKKWLAGFPEDGEIVAGPCAAQIACPDLYDPLCGEVSGGTQQTYGNACELLAATRDAAGYWPPGAAKGVTLYTGECLADPCEGKQCGDACASMFGSPLPTYCDADGACRPDKPICEAAYSCDSAQIWCDAVQPPACPDGWTYSVVDHCYGPCVPVEDCECEPGGKPTQCPDGYVCWASTERCGPYVH